MNKTKQINIVPYNPLWATMYENEAQKIGQVLGSNLLAIHHIGSTSVPELAAKPKIDIVAALIHPKQAIVELAKIGFTYKGEWNVPFKYGFTKRGDINVNLHVFKEQNPEIELNIIFRDYLRKHPNVRNAYAQLKYELLKDPHAHKKNHAMFPAYTLRKGDFIRHVLKKAGFNRLRMLRCNDHTEWQAAKKLREKHWHGLGQSDKVSILHKEHEHFLCYRGVDIVGYADVSCGTLKKSIVHMMVFHSNEDATAYRDAFKTLIDQWLALHNY